MRFATWMTHAQGSAIREILKVTVDPQIISLAGGLPAPELFPVDLIDQAFRETLAQEGQAALQYTTTEGDPELRQTLAARLARRGIRVAPEGIALCHGSQQALDLLAKIFLDGNDLVLTESPTYLGALQAFYPYGPRVRAVPCDSGGIRLDALQAELERERPKFLYVMPTYSNPGGTTLAPERRPGLLALCAEYGVPIVEDDPYGELYYDDIPVSPLKALDTQGIVIYSGTASKILAPGLRLGWIAAAPDIIRRVNLAMQGAGLHVGTLLQRAVARVLADDALDAHLTVLRASYRRRRDAMLGAMDRLFPPRITWTRPGGGMFLWVTMPEGNDSLALLQDAIQRQVAFVPGRPFCPDGSGSNSFRLNFSHPSPERIEEGIARLGGLLSERIK